MAIEINTGIYHMIILLAWILNIISAGFVKRIILKKKSCLFIDTKKSNKCIFCLFFLFFLLFMTHLFLEIKRGNGNPPQPPSGSAIVSTHPMRGSGLKFLVRGDYTKSRPRIKQVWHDKIPSWQLAMWKGMWDLSLMSDIFSYGTQSIKQIINDQSINQSMISLSNWLRIHLIKTWTYSNEKKWKKVLQSFITLLS